MEPPRQRSNSHDARVEQEEAAQSASIQGHMAQMVFDAGSAQMKQAISTYGRIDHLRPYFDVEPKTPPTDLYGPFMINFTLVALLLYTMKSGGFVAQQGTLIGTALLTCFGYWAAVSSVIYTMCYIFLCDLPFVIVAATLGYAMFGHCVVLALSALFHPAHDHLYFFGLLVLFAGLSCLRMGIYFASKARQRTHKLILLTTVSFMHCAFLAYLHFGFETMVVELEEIIGQESAALLRNSVALNADTLSSSVA